MTVTDDPLAEFDAIQGPAGCPILRAISQLSDEDQRKVTVALDTPLERVKHSTILSWMASKGVEVTESSVGRHRKGKCACER